MRPWTDEGEIALEDDVEELRQFVERGLADETADRGHARVAAGDERRCGRIEPVDIHRTEFVDLDQFVVEAVALLAEQDRPLRCRLDGDRDGKEKRRQENEAERADDLVEGDLQDDVPIGDRLVEHVEHRHRPI